MKEDKGVAPYFVCLWVFISLALVIEFFRLGNPVGVLDVVLFLQIVVMIISASVLLLLDMVKRGRVGQFTVSQCLWFLSGSFVVGYAVISYYFNLSGGLYTIYNYLTSILAVILCVVAVWIFPSYHREKTGLCQKFSSWSSSVFSCTGVICLLGMLKWYEVYSYRFAVAVVTAVAITILFYLNTSMRITDIVERGKWSRFSVTMPAIVIHYSIVGTAVITLCTLLAVWVYSKLKDWILVTMYVGIVLFLVLLWISGGNNYKQVKVLIVCMKRYSRLILLPVVIMLSITLGMKVCVLGSDSPLMWLSLLLTDFNCIAPIFCVFEISVLFGITKDGCHGSCAPYLIITVLLVVIAVLCWLIFSGMPFIWTQVFFWIILLVIFELCYLVSFFKKKFKKE